MKRKNVKKKKCENHKLLCERHMIEREKKKRNYCVDKQKLESVFYFKKEVFIFIWKFGKT